MRLGMQRFRSAQLYASAASLFVELPWVPLKLQFRLLLKELENSQKYRISELPQNSVLEKMRKSGTMALLGMI